MEEIKYLKGNTKALTVLEYLEAQDEFINQLQFETLRKDTKTTSEELDDIIYNFEKFGIVEIDDYNMLVEGSNLMHWYTVHRCNGWDNKQVLNDLKGFTDDYRPRYYEYIENHGKKENN